MCVTLYSYSSVSFGVLHWSVASGTLLVLGSSLSDGSFDVISLGKKITHIKFCLSTQDLALAGGGKTTGCSICRPGGTSGAHTTFGVTVGPPVSTWPGSTRLSVLAQKSLLSVQEAHPLGWGA